MQPILLVIKEASAGDSLESPFLKSYCGQVYFFGIVTQHSGVVLPKFGSQLPVFIEPVSKEAKTTTSLCHGDLFYFLILIHAKSERLEQTWKVTKNYSSSIVAYLMTYTLQDEGEDVVFCGFSTFQV